MTEPRSPQPTVNEIAAQQFGAWRRAPAGQLFDALLTTLRAKYVELAINKFLAGSLNEPDAQLLRGRIAICDELLNLQWAGVVDTLGPDKSPEDQKPEDDDGSQNR